MKRILAVFLALIGLQYATRASSPTKIFMNIRVTLDNTVEKFTTPLQIGIDGLASYDYDKDLETDEPPPFQPRAYFFLWDKVNELSVYSSRNFMPQAQGDSMRFMREYELRTAGSFPQWSIKWWDKPSPGVDSIIIVDAFDGKGGVKVKADAPDSILIKNIGVKKVFIRVYYNLPESSVHTELPEGSDIYPNPAEDRFTVKGFNGIYELFSGTGMLVKEGTVNDGGNIEVGGLSRGVYYFIISPYHDSRKYGKRVIIK